MNASLYLKKTPTTSLFIGLFLVLFAVIFNYTISTMSSPYIVGDLGGSNSITTYSVSLFALGNALSIPLGKPLMGRIGTCKLLISCLALFTLFSLLCAFAPNYPVFNVIRLLQGVVSGPFFITSLYLFTCLESPKKKRIFSSIRFVIFTIVPILGACFGGVIAYSGDWRWAYYIEAPLLLALTGFLYYRLQGFDSYPFKIQPFDAIGFLSYFIAISCISVALITGQELDWLRSNLILLLLSVGAVFLIFFVFWEIGHPYPLVCFRLLKNPVISFALFNLAVLFSAYFGMVILLSLWLKLWANYTPDWITALLGIMALSGLFPLLLIHVKISKIDNRLFLILSIALLILSCIHTTAFSVDIDLKRIIFSRLSAGLGLALFLAPLFRLCFFSRTEDEQLEVIVLFQVVRALSSGLGATLYAVIWLRRAVFYRERLGEQLTGFSAQTQTFFSEATTLGLKGEQPQAQLDYFLERQATALALDDCFYLMAWILGGLLLLFLFTLFIDKKKFVTEHMAENAI